MHKSDFESMLKDINDVLIHHGILKWVGFVPDRLKIDLKRENGRLTIIYKEEFTYLPRDVLEVALGNSIDFLFKIGVPRDCMSIINKGIKVKIVGGSKISRFPILELLIQDRGAVENMETTFSQMSQSIRSLSQLIEFAWSWDEETEAKWRSDITRLNELIKNHPEVQNKIEEIIRRYSGTLMT